MIKVNDVDIFGIDNMNKESIMCKIFGLMLIGVGIFVCYIEYVISTTISEIADMVALAAGLSESSGLGLSILFHLPAVGLMAILLIIIVILFYFGYIFITEQN